MSTSTFHRATTQTQNKYVQNWKNQSSNKTKGKRNETWYTYKSLYPRNLCSSLRQGMSSLSLRSAVKAVWDHVTSSWTSMEKIKKCLASRQMYFTYLLLHTLRLYLESSAQKICVFLKASCRSCSRRTTAQTRSVNMFVPFGRHSSNERPSRYEVPSSSNALPGFARCQ